MKIKLHLNGISYFDYIEDEEEGIFDEFSFELDNEDLKKTIIVHVESFLDTKLKDEDISYFYGEDYMYIENQKINEENFKDLKKILLSTDYVRDVEIVKEKNT